MNFEDNIKLFLDNHFSRISNTLRYYYFKHYKLYQRSLLYAIQKRGKAKVLFFASSLGMWRYQGLYDLLNKDERFDCRILVKPFSNYSVSEQTRCVESLSFFFKRLCIPFVDGLNNYEDSKRLISEFDPDVLFYSQPYSGCFTDEFNEGNFRKKLLCYCSYGVSTIPSNGLYNTGLQNAAWKLFYPTHFNLEDARQLAINHGENVVVSGDLNIDIIGKTAKHNPWKPQSKQKKKIIWAPHYTVKPSFCLNRASFLQLHQIMLDLSKEYEDTVQFAFKPHPRLRTELNSLDGWGMERTDSYFSKWVNGVNTQLEEGDYEDLFTTSDAMIHDSGSFSVEYLYTGKPVIFTSPDAEADIAHLNELGKACLQQHYIATNSEDVKQFVDAVVKGHDPLKQQRKDFYKNTLASPNGISAAETIYNYLKFQFKFS